MHSPAVWSGPAKTRGERGLVTGRHSSRAWRRTLHYDERALVMMQGDHAVSQALFPGERGIAERDRVVNGGFRNMQSNRCSTAAFSINGRAYAPPGRPVVVICI